MDAPKSPSLEMLPEPDKLREALEADLEDAPQEGHPDVNAVLAVRKRLQELTGVSREALLKVMEHARKQFAESLHPNMRKVLLDGPLTQWAEPTMSSISLPQGVIDRTGLREYDLMQSLDAACRQFDNPHIKVYILNRFEEKPAELCFQFKN